MLPTFLLCTVTVCATMLMLACDVPTTCLRCSTLLSQLAVADSTDTFACYIVNASPRLPLILLLGMGVIACCSCLVLLTVVSAARHCCLLQVNNTVLLLHAHNVLGVMSFSRHMGAARCTCHTMSRLQLGLNCLESPKQAYLISADT